MVLAYPKIEGLLPTDPPVFVGHIDDLEKLARTHPEDAAKLRRALDALMYRMGESVERVISVNLRDLNAALNPSIFLASYPPQRDLTLTVNGHGYRVGLFPRYGYRVGLIPNYEERLDLEEDGAPDKDIVKMAKAQIPEDVKQLQRLIKKYGIGTLSKTERQ